MSKEKGKKYSFKDIDEVRDYLEEGLPVTEEGRYYYVERGINLYDTDALILFQFNAEIVGYGIFKDRKYDERYFQFYPESIHNIEEISAEELRSVYPPLKGLTRTQIIPLDYLKPISLLLKRKQKSYKDSILIERIGE